MSLFYPLDKSVITDKATCIQLDPDDELQVVDVGAILDGDSTARPLATQIVSYACHTLQIVVQDGLKKLPASTSQQVAKVTSYVASVKRFTVAAEVRLSIIVFSLHFTLANSSPRVQSLRRPKAQIIITCSVGLYFAVFFLVHIYKYGVT